jgi:hypothetical protein
MLRSVSTFRNQERLPVNRDGSIFLWMRREEAFVVDNRGTMLRALAGGVADTRALGLAVTMTDRSAFREVQTDEQRAQQAETYDDSVGLTASSESPASDAADRAPYATRLRVVLLLSLLTWALIIAAVTWLFA